MARDSQAALVALNRFGFGARGGASGDFVNAASDPRGFVKSELNRPNGLLLEVPGLQSTPALRAARARSAIRNDEPRLPDALSLRCCGRVRDTSGRAPIAQGTNAASGRRE